MFAIERIKIIKNYLIENKQLEVNILSKMLNVSEVTIRRDLEKLEKEGFITRTHGGAVLNTGESIYNENLLADNTDDESVDYSDIADIAIEMINDDDVIMLSNGEINLSIAKKLTNKKNLTVVTNDILIAAELTNHQTIKVILLGGVIDSSTKSVFGTLTIDNLNLFFVNKLFIEVNGISNNLDVTVSSMNMASLIQASIKNSNERIVLCSSEAFKKNSFYKVGKLTEITEKIITNSNINDNFKTEIFNNNIQLFTSVNAFEDHI
ncbi:DeoR/GlpR family DNA-binding transcription regulator [Clostridium sp. C2-6-12]|uniref:DeoR/GlpR family DNA-binding transcription regulator n=1 Tax=Clostridium sp. C2-6-12 TaxID=2698832 RepID=UPI00136DE82B|nr:DeoR/GlpR family DNA-binding transcription regulator [Clostridium sp. C2-6-12]